MTAATPPPVPSSARRHLLEVLRFSVIVSAVALIAYITYDTLRGVTFLTSGTYLKVQLWICIFFEAEIIAETILSQRRGKALLRNLAFFLICIPYLSIIHHFGLTVSPRVSWILRWVPLIRAAWVLAAFWGIMSRGWVTSMFGAYMIMLIATLYFLSLMFYVEEHGVNPEVYNYWQALWYSIMQMTTCGSSVTPVTNTGKIMGVILSAEGLILFPVFTVYFTHAFKNSQTSGEST